MENHKSAIFAILKLLNALRDKNYTDFKNCFNKNNSWGFIDVLPGGAVVNCSNQLIDMHTAFFNEAATKFEPIYKSENFTIEYMC